MPEEVKTGTETTEFAVQQKAGVWGIIGMILGFLAMSGPTVLEKITGVLNPDPSAKWVVIGGAVVSAASLFYKTAVDCGYIKSRTEVKLMASAPSPSSGEGGGGQ